MSGWAWPNQLKELGGKAKIPNVEEGFCQQGAFSLRLQSQAALPWAPSLLAHPADHRHAAPTAM